MRTQAITPRIPARSALAQPPQLHRRRWQTPCPAPILHVVAIVRQVRHVYDDRHPRTAAPRAKLQVRTVWQSRPWLGWPGSLCCATAAPKPASHAATTLAAIDDVRIGVHLSIRSAERSRIRWVMQLMVAMIHCCDGWHVASSPRKVHATGSPRNGFRCFSTVSRGNSRVMKTKRDRLSRSPSARFGQSCRTSGG